MKKEFSIQRIGGDIIFTYSCENNTFGKTVAEAVKQNVSLQYSNLSNRDLSLIDLSRADLQYADLTNTNLHGAFMQDVNLRHSKLNDAELTCAYLWGVNLSSAILYGANLKGISFFGTNLYATYLSGAKNIPYIPMNVPEGEFIAYKKLPNNLIVKLKILEDSKRSRATTDKCRCDKALVLEFQNIDGSPSYMTEYTSSSYAECKYKVGEIVEADEWDNDRWNECSHGIHFFLDRQTAVNY